MSRWFRNAGVPSQGPPPYTRAHILGWTLPIAALSCLLASCQPPAASGITILPGFSPVETAAIEAGIASWGDTPMPSMTIMNVNSYQECPTMGPLATGHTVTATHLVCLLTPQPNMQRTAAHEVGHVLGLGHMVPPSVMTVPLSVDTPQPEDFAALVDNHRKDG